MKQIVLLSLLFSFSTYAVQEFTFSTAAVSNTVKDFVSEDIQSSDGVGFSFGYKWFVGTRVHLLLSMDKRNYSIKTEDIVVLGDDKVSLQRFDFGFRFVLSSKVALSISASKAEVLDFNIISGELEVLKETLSFYSLTYNQVLIQFRPFNIGFELKYDFSSSAGDIGNRRQTAGRIYSVIGRGAHRARLFVGLEVENKSIDEEEVLTNNSAVGLEYIFRF